MPPNKHAFTAKAVWADFFSFSFFPSSPLCDFSASLLSVSPRVCGFGSLFLCCFSCWFCFLFFLCLQELLFFLVLFFWASVSIQCCFLFFPLASMFMYMIRSAAKATVSSAPKGKTTRAIRKNNGPGVREDARHMQPSHVRLFFCFAMVSVLHIIVL